VSSEIILLGDGTVFARWKVESYRLGFL